MSYFQNFERILYDIKEIRGELKIKPITNILNRVRMKTDFLSNRVYYSDYAVLDGETPETVAHDFYGDSSLHWIVMFAQQITNPYYDWPLSYYDLNKFVAKKYGANINAVKHHVNADGDIVDATASGAQPITNFKYELSSSIYRKQKY